MIYIPQVGDTLDAWLDKPSTISKIEGNFLFLENSTVKRYFSP